MRVVFQRLTHLEMHKAAKAGRPAKSSTALQGKRGLAESIVSFASANEHPVSKAFAGRLADHFKAYMARRLLYDVPV